jgi:hypothetical protein
VSRPDIRDFAEGVELQRLQRANVIHGSSVREDC